MVRNSKILKTQMHPNTAAHIPLPRHPDLIKLLSRILPKLQEANADCANAGRGAHGPAAAARVGMQAVWSPGVASLCSSASTWVPA